MPMRQPCGSSAPACSPATSSGVVPSVVDLLAAGQEADAAAAAAEVRGGDDGPEALEVQSLGDAGALEALGQRVQQAGRTARPGLALAPVGHAPVELGDVPPAVAIVVVLVQRVAVVPARRARADRRRRSCPRPTGRCARARRREGPRGAAASARSIPMTGVTPLPAVTNSSGCSTPPGARTRPVGGASRTTMPRRAWLTRCSDTSPPAMRLTVMAMRPSRRPGSDVSE